MVDDQQSPVLAPMSHIPVQVREPEKVFDQGCSELYMAYSLNVLGYARKVELYLYLMSGLVTGCGVLMLLVQTTSRRS